MQPVQPVQRPTKRGEAAHITSIIVRVALRVPYEVFHSPGAFRIGGIGAAYAPESIDKAITLQGKIGLAPLFNIPIV